jgi:hypothetical protein
LKDEKTNHIGTLIFTKLKQNDLIGTIGYRYVFAVPHQFMNELIRPDSFGFSSTLHVQHSCRSRALRFYMMREKAHPHRSLVSEVCIYRNHEDVIGVVTVPPNVVLS